MEICWPGFRAVLGRVARHLRSSALSPLKVVACSAVLPLLDRLEQRAHSVFYRRCGTLSYRQQDSRVAWKQRFCVTRDRGRHALKILMVSGQTSELVWRFRCCYPAVTGLPEAGTSKPRQERRTYTELHQQLLCNTSTDPEESPLSQPTIYGWSRKLAVCQ